MFGQYLIYRIQLLGFYQGEFSYEYYFFYEVFSFKMQALSFKNLRNFVQINQTTSLTEPQRNQQRIISYTPIIIERFQNIEYSFILIKKYQPQNHLSIAKTTMGRQNRGKNNRRNNNNRSNTQQSQQNNYPKASQQQLQVECLQLYELLSNKTKILKEQKLDYCYIISTKWLEEWKQYVGYYNLEENDQKKHKKIGKKHPGKINQQLVVDSKGFYHIPLDQYDYLNVVLSDKKDQDDDYIAVAEQIWNLFASKYDHVEIRRPKKISKKGSIFYDGLMLQLQVVIVNYSDEQLMHKVQEAKNMPKRDLDDEFPCLKMQLPELWKMQDLELFLRLYCEAVYEEKKFRVWRIQGYSSIGPVQRALWQGVNKNLDKMPVPIRQLTRQKFGSLDLDEFLKTNYSLVLEVGDSRIQTAKVPDPLQGYCEDCVKKKILNYQCLCGEMFYCSEQCRIVDQVHHQKACKLAFESSDDEEYEKKTIDFTKHDLPASGLVNLGNTCYMNSVLQALTSVQEYANFFSSNNYHKQVDPKQYEEHQCRLLSKYGKFIKKLCEVKQSLSPWSLKGEINYFMPPFKGFKQHDANDFLVNFLNCLNQQLLKQQNKAYHPILEDNFIGEFNSLIKCPSCTIEISNDEIFSQLTLPIKQRTKVQTANYVIYQSARKIIHGKMVIDSDWQSMRKALKQSDTCLLMAGREGEHVIDVDEQQVPQKSVKKLKRDLVFYPNCQYNDSDELFSVIPITSKMMYGSRMKSPYNYPAIINVDPQLHTLATFWIQILKEFCPPEIHQQATKIKQSYYQQIQSLLKTANEQSQSTQQSNEEAKKSQQQQQDKMAKQIQQNHNDQLRALVTKHNLMVFINDLKKGKNKCHFCQKKCNGCELPIDFSKELKEYLDGKDKEANFEVLLEDKLDQVNIENNVAKSGEASLHDCMELLTQPQQLDEENAWWCQTCQDMRLALKQLAIKKLPKILTIHLNRFKAQGEKKVKNSQPIEYQQFQEFCGKKYQLLSVIVHQGSTQGGHYWAICRRNDKYYVFNDSKVSPTDKICNKNAYILIYRAV